MLLLFADFSASAITPELLECSKVIVSVPQLLQLVPSQCIRYNCFKPIVIKEQYKGCVLLLNISCEAGHCYTWSSSGEHLNAAGIALHGNNLLLAAVCLLSGNSYSKIYRMFQFMGLHCFSEQMYYRYNYGIITMYRVPPSCRYQNAYLLQPIESFWKTHQLQVFS